MKTKSRRWVITGVSGGFGRLLAGAALEAGDSVVGTVRQQEQIGEFEALCPGRAHGVLLDVTDRARARQACQEAVDALGGVDILVNNAGYGLAGALEEMDDSQVDHVLGTNLFGTINMIRGLLPELRRSGGMIVNLSSMAGLVGVPGMSIYCAAKHAVEGLSSALRNELAPLGVRMMVVEPGSFRTSFVTSSMRFASNAMDLYAETPAGQVRNISAYSGHEPGDPDKAIEEIMRAIESDEPPFRLVLGSDALRAIDRHLKDFQSNLEQWREVSLRTDYKQNETA